MLFHAFSIFSCNNFLRISTPWCPSPSVRWRRSVGFPLCLACWHLFCRMGGRLPACVMHANSIYSNLCEVANVCGIQHDQARWVSGSVDLLICSSETTQTKKIDVKPETHASTRGWQSVKGLTLTATSLSKGILLFKAGLREWPTEWEALNRSARSLSSSWNRLTLNLVAGHVRAIPPGSTFAVGTVVLRSFGYVEWESQKKWTNLGVGKMGQEPGKPCQTAGSDQPKNVP